MNSRNNRQSGRNPRATSKTNKRRNRIILILSILLLSYIISVAVTIRTTLNVQALGQRTEIQEKNLTDRLNENYPERTSISLSPNPFAADFEEISLMAKSAIMIDTETGDIIYEKNADVQIPPASMTKIVEMYVVFDAIERGQASLDDVVPLPPESWEINIPWDASRMHLAEGQKVTLRELLLGLAICSGNDASVAVAHYISGDMDSFVAKMNSTVESMGLTKTKFVESSGYSEENLTTAREFAIFARQYINRFPQALEEFHSQLQIKYPEPRNVPDSDDNFQSYIQPNTNKLLETIPGCDGLKTGYIDESGYNISVTAKRNGTRFLSVTMNGPGSNMIEGNRYRVSDNTKLFDFAFENFTDYRAPEGENAHEYTVGIFGGKEKAVKLVPALKEVFTVPMTVNRNDENPEPSSISTRVEVPKYLYGKVECGKQYGTISYMLNGSVYKSIPLVADRSVESGNPLSMLIGKTCAIAVNLFQKN